MLHNNAHTAYANGTGPGIRETGVVEKLRVQKRQVYQDIIFNNVPCLSSFIIIIIIIARPQKLHNQIQIIPHNTFYIHKEITKI